MIALFNPVRDSSAGDDEFSKTFIHVVAPRTRAGFQTFVLGHQSLVGESNLGTLTPLHDLEKDLGSVPIELVLHEIQVTLQHVPHDFFVGDELSYPQL